MARRIKSRKRKHYGNRFFGGGNAKNRRGKGNKGGKGNAGYHKHKWLRTIKLGMHKNRKHGFFSTRQKPEEFTLEQISRQIAGGKWPKESSGYKVSLGKNSKVLSTGSLDFPAEITAAWFSAGAVEKISSAGGKVVSLAREKEKAKVSA